MQLSISMMALTLALAAVPMAHAAPSPEGAAAQASTAIQYDRFTLPNGLRVIVSQDKSIPFVHVGIWYHVGSRDEREGRTGFAHLFEHLLFNGSEHHDEDFFRPIEQMGALDSNGTTYLDRTNFYETVPVAGLDRTLWLESDRMGHSLAALVQAKLDEQRGVVKNEKRLGENQPYAKADKLLNEGLFPEGHPYQHSTIGSMEDLDAASVDDVRQWFRTWYGPNNAVVVLVGDIDIVTAKNKMAQYFGDIPAAPEPTRARSNVPVRLADTEELTYDNVSLPAVYRAWISPPLGDPQSLYLSLAAGILGGSKTSRLYDRLVVRDKLANDVFMQASAFELSGMADVRVRAKSADDLPRIRAIIQEELDRFFRDGPTAEELAARQMAMEAELVQGQQFLSARANMLAEGELYRGDPNASSTALALARAATPRQVRDAAKFWLSRGSHLVTVLPNPTYNHAARGADRTAMPPVGPASDIVMPERKTATLSNGIPVEVVSNHAAPTVAVSLLFDAGMAAEPKGKEGISAFTFDMLDEGADGRSAAQIARAGELNGSMLMIGGDSEWGSAMMLAIKRKLAPSLALLSDVVTRADFPAADVERLRADKVQAIRDGRTSPSSMARLNFMPALFGADHPYGRPAGGSEASLAAISRDDLVAFRNAWIRPERARLMVVGDVTMEEVLPMLESSFGRWRGTGGPGTAAPVPVVVAPVRPRLILVDRPGSEQSQIMAGYVLPPMDEAERFRVRNANTILGGYFSSRINLNLREDKGWAYGAGSAFQHFKAQNLFQVTTSVQTDKTAEALTEIRKELADIRTTRPITPAEVAPVITGEVGSLPGKFQSAWETMNYLTGNVKDGQPYDYAATLRQRYEALSAPALAEATSRLVQPGSVTWVVVGDMAKVGAKIRALNLGEIVEPVPNTP